jgi:hypothetical protein
MSSQFMAAVTFALLLVGPAPQHQHGSAETLGVVRFPTSCAAAAQPLFNRAVALLHSFEFGRAIDAFICEAADRPGRPELAEARRLAGLDR